MQSWNPNGSLCHIQYFSQSADASQPGGLSDSDQSLRAGTGKGVILPENIEEAKASLEAILIGESSVRAGNEVVIEERLTGPEITLLAFSDGLTVKPMVPSQDHKRALEGDKGLNTGGMGAYAPLPICPPAMVSDLILSLSNRLWMREHAIAWKIAQSPMLSKLTIVPGNAGTAALGENVSVNTGDHSAMLRLCQEKRSTWSSLDRNRHWQPA